MTTGLVKEQNIQKQMGCMAGFLHIFDRHQFLAGKRFYSAKRLHPPPVVDSTSESEISIPPSPKSENPSSKNTPPSIPPLPLPMFESKGVGIKSTWRFRKEAPRLSLDSRATTDAKGSLHPKQIPTSTDDDNNHSNPTDGGGGEHHRSPSVIARLMGLEPLPSSSQPDKHPELRRSASESRVSKDLFQSRFLPNGAVFNTKPTDTPVDVQRPDPRNYSNKNAPKSQGNGGLNRGGANSTPPQWRAPPHRKGFFDSGDIFPQPKQIVTIHGEIEKRIRMRGANEPSQDLETLKQILEALQLKGLLHSRTPSSQQNQIRHRNFVYDESPIVLMKPSRSPISGRRMGSDYSPRSGRRNYNVAAGETQSPQRERNTRSPTRTSRSPTPTPRTVKPKQLLSVHTTTQRRRTNESPENRNASPIHSPKLNTRRTGTDPTVVNRLTTRSKKPASEIHQKVNALNGVVLEDESSSNSGSSVTTTTSTDTERLKVVEEHTDRRSLLERCDKLLHIIADVSSTDAQPSPVSVLDSSFYKDESMTPSPVTTKRIIDFKDHQSGELDEEIYSPPVSPIQSKRIETSYDSDFVYISDILRAIHYLPENSDVFQLLEKQQNLQGFDARLDRKLIFDTIDEILGRNNRLPPWNITTLSLDKVWSEFERIRERDSVDDLFESICRVLKKDLAGDVATGWVDCPVEMSEAVLDIERLIFKDLICDSIGDLAELASRNTLSVVPRRRLVF